jgi:hypothetical protein
MKDVGALVSARNSINRDFSPTGTTVGKIYRAFIPNIKPCMIFGRFSFREFTPLCWKYKSHINVEARQGLYSVKHIHMYIHKGSDRATVVFDTCSCTREQRPTGNTVETDLCTGTAAAEKPTVEKCFRLHLRKPVLIWSSQYQPKYTGTSSPGRKTDLHDWDGL